jgi:hypothetical protein
MSADTLHVPERLNDESREEYAARRARARTAVRAIIGKGLGGGISSRKQFRDAMRANGTMGKRIRAANALLAAWASKRVPNWKGGHDAAGAFTLTGRPRRKWVAGISAQRAGA